MKRAKARQWIFGAVICAAAAASGVQVAGKAGEMRAAYTRLSEEQARRDALLEEYSRLILERGTLSSYRNVDRIANDVLSMHFPEEVNWIPQ
ncbi:MAG: cell division protein FtsL [Gammaproteobacteria bacterium]|nr:cell division protein FtsL [Gammaproteobacteria bacterium]MDE0224531.1 cell division protein FtsL [Gammaproteobacteria bacterium]MDE0451957.1 cell division protein FtsL [Gammaproteobacteria bacterium]